MNTVLKSLKAVVSPSTAADLREELSRANADAEAAETAWELSQTDARWKVAEDARRRRDQLAIRLRAAEKREGEAAAAEAASARAAKVAKLAELRSRIDSFEGFTNAEARASVEAHRALAERWTRIVHEVDALRRLHAEATQLEAELGERERSLPTFVDERRLLRVVQGAIEKASLSRGEPLDVRFGASNLVADRFLGEG